MRFLKPLLLMLTAQTLFGATPFTIQQVQDLIRTAKQSKRLDSDVALKLSSVELSESLNDARLEELLRDSSGKKTSAALRLMADESVFQPVPQADWLKLPAPTAEQQSAILAKIRRYASDYVHGLPNYLVTAEIHRFDGDPALFVEAREIWNGLHARDRTINQLRYSDGQESYSVLSVKGTPNSGGGGLKTLGEFSGIFAALFASDSGVTMQWDHWQKLQSTTAAVFEYAVPAAHSRLTVVSGEMRIMPGYRGKLFADPESGAVLRMTRQADDQPPDFPTRRSDTFVDYHLVSIGGSGYFLPARSVTFSRVTGPRMASGAQTSYPFARWNVMITAETDYLNETIYSNYRKFEAESVVASIDSESEMHAGCPAANLPAGKPEPGSANLTKSTKSNCANSPSK